jgi:hypothetical protein
MFICQWRNRRNSIISFNIHTDNVSPLSVRDITCTYIPGDSAIKLIFVPSAPRATFRISYSAAGQHEPIIMFIALGFVLLQLAAASLTNGHSWQETDRGFGQPRQGTSELPRCRFVRNLTCSIVGRSRTSINSGLRMNVQNGVQQRPARRTKSPARIEQLQPVLRADAKRVRLYFGPYSIPGRHVCMLQKQ